MKHLAHGIYEEILEGAFKNPLLGIVITIIFGGTSTYFVYFPYDHIGQRISIVRSNFYHFNIRPTF